MPYYKRFFEIGFDVMCICNKTHFLEVNDAMISLLGYSRNELLSRSYYEFMHPEDVEISRNAIGSIQRGFENRYLTKEKKIVWLRWAVHPNIDRGDVMHCVAKDITDQKMIAAHLGKYVIDLQKSERAAKQARDEAQTLAYAASHDLQEPLRTIMNWAAFLRDDYGELLPPEGKEMLGYILDSAQRGRDLVLDLLQLSRIGRDATFRMIDMDAVVDKSVLDLELLIRETAAEVSRDRLPVVWGDASMLRLLVKNLVSNAVKFAKPGLTPCVKIQGKAIENGWLFSVQDEGIGLEPAYAQKIFGVFTRLDTNRPGTGIGLAICKKIIDLHEGRIWIESSPGAGATVFFTISGLPGKHHESNEDSADTAGGGPPTGRQAIRADPAFDGGAARSSYREGRGGGIALLASNGTLRDRPAHRSRPARSEPAQGLWLRSVGRGKAR